MAKIKLTESSLSKLPTPDSGQAVYWDDALAGFGVVVGTTRRTFIVKSRVDGKQRKVTVGVWGQVNEDGYPWTVVLARAKAKETLGGMAAGRDPVPAEGPARGDRRTLQDALTRHLADMRKLKRSPRSMKEIEDGVRLHLAAWLARPMSELTGPELVEIHDRLTTLGKERTANKVLEWTSALWCTLDRVEPMPGRNPTKAVRRNRQEESRERVEDHGLGEWYAKVQTLTPVRRDLQMFFLFTGMRSEAGREVEWVDVDLKEGVLKVPDPKGGAARAFSLPLCKTLVDMLKVRQKDNARRFAALGGDAGYVFPGIAQKGEVRVQPLSQPKEYRKGQKWLPNPHALRRTWLSVASDEGVSELDRHVLANHAYSKQNVNATYIKQAFPHLVKCAARIEAGLWRRIKARGAAVASPAEPPPAKRPPRRSGTSRARAAS